MTIRRLLTALAAGAALVAVTPANAGGPFQRIVGVGANGTVRAILLRQTGPRSETALRGRGVSVPGSGFVRLYPLNGGLPADPGRYYPARQVLCLYWQEPASNCVHLGRAGIDLLAPFATLPLRHRAPTTAVEVRYRSRPLRYANGNIFAALERRSAARFSPPRHAIRLEVRWRGPNASRMPSVVRLAPRGLYTSHRFSVLPRGAWCYLATNLPHASATLIEAADRVCR